MSTLCSVKLESRHWATIGLAAVGVAILATGRGLEYLAVIIPALITVLAVDKAMAERHVHRTEAGKPSSTAG